MTKIDVRMFLWWSKIGRATSSESKFGLFLPWIWSVTTMWGMSVVRLNRIDRAFQIILVEHRNWTWLITPKQNEVHECHHQEQLWDSHFGATLDWGQRCQKGSPIHQSSRYTITRLEEEEEEIHQCCTWRSLTKDFLGKRSRLRMKVWMSPAKKLTSLQRLEVLHGWRQEIRGGTTTTTTRSAREEEEREVVQWWRGIHQSPGRTTITTTTTTMVTTSTTTIIAIATKPNSRWDNNPQALSLLKFYLVF